MAKSKAFTKETVQAQFGKGVPEKGFFKEAEQLKKFYKHLSSEQLAEWITVEGLEFKPSESEPINRMRQCMAILYSHFPKAPAQKKKAKYADYSLEQLVDLALENSVAFEPTDDERIMRMRAIVALRDAKIIQ